MTRADGRRAWNERFVAHAERYRFGSRVPLQCECRDPDCREILLVTVERYRKVREQADFLTAPEHAVDAAEPVVREADLWLQRRASPPQAGNEH